MQPAAPRGRSPKDGGAQEAWEQRATIPGLREVALVRGEGVAQQVLPPTAGSVQPRGPLHTPTHLVSGGALAACPHLWDGVPRSSQARPASPEQELCDTGAGST